MMVLAAQAPPPLLLLSPSGNGDGYAEGRGPRADGLVESTDRDEPARAPDSFGGGVEGSDIMVHRRLHLFFSVTVTGSVSAQIQC